MKKTVTFAPRPQVRSVVETAPAWKLNPISMRPTVVPLPRLVALPWVILTGFLFASCVARSQANFTDRLDTHRRFEPFEASPVDQQSPDIASRAISFYADEGTWMSVDISPDGEMLIFDLLGDIYQLPMVGGEAIPLTRGRAWDQAPRFSLDGASIYFVSDREGTKNIWQLILSDASLHRITQSNSDVLGTPNWSQNGTRLMAGLGDRTLSNAEIILHSINPRTGRLSAVASQPNPAFDLDAFKSLRPFVKIFSAAQSADGQIYFGQAAFDRNLNRRMVRLHRLDPATLSRTTLTPLDATYSEYKPQISHDGSRLAYFRQYSDRRTEVRILDLPTEQDKVLIELIDADDGSYSPSDDSRPNYAFTPDDRRLVFWHAGKIYRVNVADGSNNIVPFRAEVERRVLIRVQPTVQTFDEIGEATIIRWPSLSRDGQTIVFAAIGYVWVMELETGLVQRLTTSAELEYMPALSPDGKSVAYISFAQHQNDYGLGHLMVAHIDGGLPRELLSDANETYLLPNWSEDGQIIAVIREVNTAGEGFATFGWTPTANGKYHEVASAPASNEHLSAPIYALSVGFDETGERLLFSFPRSRSEVVLAAADLDGRGQQTIAVGTSEIGGITPAPDLTNLILTRHDGTIWVAPFNTCGEQTQVSTKAPDTRRIIASAGYYVHWNNADTVTFGFGQNVYRYDLNQKLSESLRVQVPITLPKAAQPFAFTHARLITMSDDDNAEKVIESGSILVIGRRIAAIGTVDDVVIPTDAHIINLTGKTIMPGLIDTHYHSIGGRGISAFKLPNSSFSDRSAIAYGITTAWEPGGAASDGVPATADLQRAGRIVGPRWSHSSMGRVGYPWEQLTTFGDAIAAVKRQRDLGATVLKEYNTPTRQQRQWLSAAAHVNGLGIVSHIQSFDGMMTRIVDGYTGGDHPYIPTPFFKDVEEILRQTGYVWTPNIMISSGSLGGSTEARSLYWHEIFEKRPSEREKLRSMTPADRVVQTGDAESAVPYENHRVRRVAEQAASAAKLGIHIGVSAHSIPGAKLHGELWYLWMGGLPIEDVLRAATIGNAEKLGLQEEIGSLEVGKIADFLVLDENPLDDIINTLSLKYTVQSGNIYVSDTVQQADLSNVRE